VLNLLSICRVHVLYKKKVYKKLKIGFLMKKSRILASAANFAESLPTPSELRGTLPPCIAANDC